jgi:hypothetical protein
MLQRPANQCLGNDVGQRKVPFRKENLFDLATLTHSDATIGVERRDRCGRTVQATTAKSL